MAFASRPLSSLVLSSSSTSVRSVSSLSRLLRPFSSSSFSSPPLSIHFSSFHSFEFPSRFSLFSPSASSKMSVVATAAASTVSSSLQLVDSIINYVTSQTASGAASSSSAAAPSTSSSSSTSASSKTPADIAWYPVVPVGHTAYTWYGEEGTVGSPIQSDAPAFVSKSPKTNPITAAAIDAIPSILESKTESSSSSSSSSTPAPAPSNKTPAPEKEKKKGGAKPTAASPTTPAVDQPDFSHMEIRVGQIISASRHPDPSVESLYVEQIDVGEAEPRSIASGLVKFVPLEEFSKARVLVICNLKPSNLKGFTSHGMVLAASNTDRSIVELVIPPPSAAVGERIGVEGLDIHSFPADAIVDAKKKNNAWGKVAEKLRVNGEGIATYDGKALTTKAGVCKSTTLKDAIIS